MKSDYLVSIIMTCHNGELYLKKAMESLLQQTYTEWELIFYDNYSNDTSYEIIKSYNDTNEKLIYIYENDNSQIKNYKLECNKILIFEILKKVKSILKKNNI